MLTRQPPQDDHTNILGVYWSVDALQFPHHPVDPEEEFPRVLIELHPHGVESVGDSPLVEIAGAVMLLEVVPTFAVGLRHGHDLRGKIFSGGKN